VNIHLDPESWTEIPDDHDLREHINELREDPTANRFNFFQTDDGWCVEVVHRTSGACDAVGATFLLPAEISNLFDEMHDDSEERIIWRSGLGIQVVVNFVEPT